MLRFVRIRNLPRLRCAPDWARVGGARPGLVIEKPNVEPRTNWSHKLKYHPLLVGEAKP